MTTTAGTIVTAALRNLGAVALEEVPTAAESNEGLRVLNNMIDSWGTESLMVYSMSPNVFIYPSFKSVYTQGPGGDLNGNRFNKIGLAFSRDSQGNDFACYLTDDYQDYATLVTKQTQSNLPQIIYVNYGYPLNQLYIWPVPLDNTYSLVLWAWDILSEFANLSAVVTLPPGYASALEYNLACELGPKFGRQVTQDMATLAVKYKAQIKRINHTTSEMQMPGQLSGRNNYSYYDFIAGR